MPSYGQWSATSPRLVLSKRPSSLTSRMYHTILLLSAIESDVKDITSLLSAPLLLGQHTVNDLNLVDLDGTGLMSMSLAL